MSGPNVPQPVVPDPKQHPYHVGRTTKAGGVVIPKNPDSSGH